MPRHRAVSRPRVVVSAAWAGFSRAAVPALALGLAFCLGVVAALLLPVAW